MAKSKISQQDKLKKLAERIVAQVERQAGKGLPACASFLAGRVKETLSVPAPRKKVVNSFGDIYYRASTKATYGAPPRKVTSRMRSSVTWEVNSDKTRALIGLKARSDRNFNYPKYLEKHTSHVFLVSTAIKYRAELIRIMGRRFK